MPSFQVNLLRVMVTRVISQKSIGYEDIIDGNVGLLGL